MSDQQPTTPDSAGVDRTATGAIASQGQTTTPAATTPQTTTTPEDTEPEPSLVNQETKSLANQAPQASQGAPEAYGAFNVPEGFVLDEGVAKEAGGLFKSMNLTQAQGQQLVDFYINKTSEAANAPYEVWRQMQAQWQKEVKSDPILGRNLPQVTQTISRAIDTVARNNPKLAEDFRAVMDYTGAGNNPHFIRMFYEMAQLITEGQHVAGRGPSPAGQRLEGSMPSAARAMYPNLP